MGRKVERRKKDRKDILSQKKVSPVINKGGAWRVDDVKKAEAKIIKEKAEVRFCTPRNSLRMSSQYISQKNICRAQSLYSSEAAISETPFSQAFFSSQDSQDLECRKQEWQIREMQKQNKSEESKSSQNSLTD